MTISVIDTTSRRSGIARDHFSATNGATEAFFSSEAERIARACNAMAERFQSSGRLLIYGDGAQRSDVAHVVVEFMHPVIVGKRALPAMSLCDAGCTDVSSLLQRLETLGRGGDILLVLAGRSINDGEQELLQRGEANGLLTVSLTGQTPDVVGHASERFTFRVPSDDPCIVQEVHEILYHVLWELVHVFLDHRAVGT